MVDSRGAQPLGGSGLPASMESIISNQKAASEEMRSVVTELSLAASMMTNILSSMEEGMGATMSPGSRPRIGMPSSYRGGPNGSRPTMQQNQTKRPDHGAGLSGLRGRAADYIHQNFGAASVPQFIPTSDGGHIRIDPKTGAKTTLGPGEADVGELAAAGRASKISSAAGLLKTGSAMGALRTVPYVGTALMAGEATMHLIGHEREKNAQYQSIYGGSNIGTGFHQRRLQEGYRLSQMFSGGLTGSQATQAFQGVSALGFSGDQRSRDLNFISANYKSMGMGVAESLQLITTASKDLNTNLVGLKQGLSDVSAAAKETGQNAGTARQNFAQTYSVLGAQFPGTGTPQLASNLSSVQTKLGRGFAGLDYTGALTSQSSLAVLAAHTGQSLTQVRANIAAGDPKIYSYLDYQLARATAPSENPNVKAAINSLAQQAGGVSAIMHSGDPSKALQDIAQKLEQSGLISTDVLSNAFKASGLSRDPQQAGMEFVATALGVNNHEAQYKADLAKNNQQPGQSSSKWIASGPRGSGGHYVTTTGAASNPFIDTTKKTLGAGTNVVVQTGSGQVVVSLDQAAKLYPDQIAKGTALVDDGSGRTVKDAMGGQFEQNYGQYGGVDTTNNKVKGISTPQNMKDVLKAVIAGKPIDYAAMQKVQTQVNNKQDGGTVTISPSPELQRLLNFSSSGNINISTQGAALGATPIPGQVPGN